MTENFVRRVTAVLLSLLLVGSAGSAGIGFIGTAAAQEGSDGTVSFGASELTGGPNIDNPTSLQFGPDGRLYVSEQYGQIHVLDVTRNGPNDYQVTDSETIDSVANLPNHDDDGNYQSEVGGREVTGIVVGGTAGTPVLYVASSDPRIGGGGSGDDTNLDTNSGVISRLTPTGTGWDHEMLVRGLPRSEENHATNGLVLDESTNTLYAAQGGHTNMGGISNNFAYSPEYALAAAILEIDLGQVDGMSEKDAANTDVSYRYDLPTLAGTAEPFGGQNGLNMAKLVAGGPVGIYSPGYRNSYDITMTDDGQLYTIDNGPNGGWGDVPVGEGSAGACTNEPNEPGDTLEDHLHLVTEGSYGGHPNPTRGNPDGAGLYDENGTQIGSVADAVYDGYDVPVECEYQGPGEDGSMVSFGASTNGLDEYSASNFDGAMQGDLLAASFDGNVYRVQLNSAGDAVTDKSKQFSSGLSTPLDVTTQGDEQVFNGTVWVADFGGDDIDVFEPADTSGTDTSCDTSDPDGDADGDGYTNADELAAETDPCSAASVPEDYDGDNVSNLNDDDDDNDGLLDTEDPFAVDPDNGLSTTLPVEYDFSRDSVPDSLEGLGFTGLMTNGVDDYQDLYIPGDSVFGGANPALTVENVKAGDAYESQNSQQHAYQFGVVAPDEPFTIHAPVTGYPENPQNYQAAGVQLGAGDQDNYLKLVVQANGGTGGVQFAKEVGGSFDTVSQPDDPAVTESGAVTDLYMTVYPSNDTVVATYTVNDGTEVTVGKTTIPSSWIDNGDQGLAVGVIATSYKASEFAVTWNDFEVTAADTAGNQAPTADAGADVVAEENTTVDLDGTDSFDPDGDALGYSWVQTAGPDVTLDAQDSPSPSFDAPSVDDNTTLAFELNVSDGNASDTDTVNVTVQDANTSGDVNAAPTAAFTSSPSNPNASEQVTFDASDSNDTDGTIESYEWDFDGDGTIENTTSDPVTTHAYADNGTYNATLTVTDDDGTADSVQQTIAVGESSSDGGDGSPPSGETVFAVNAGGSAYTASDGTVYEADANFAGGKTYQVSSSTEIENTEDDPLYRTERYGDFSYNVPVENGSYAVTLEFAEIYFGTESGDPNGGTGDRVFDVNVEDGEVELANYDIYADTGALTATNETYTVDVTDGTLNVAFSTDVNNAKVSAIEVVSVDDTTDGDGDTNAVPTATFTYSPESPNATETVAFDASGSNDTDGSITSYEWEFGDGTTATGATVTHAYADDGTYNATLTVTDDENATNSTQQTITVGVNDSDGTTDNQPPNASFTFSPAAPNLSEEVTFDASGSNDSDGTITEYAWDFDGDGAVDNTTSDPITTYAYAENGTYTATLTVTDNDSATNSSQQTITVGGSSGGGDGSTPSGETVFAVNAGGSAYTASDGTVYEADTNFAGGKPYTVSSSTAIENTGNDPLYRSERYGDFSYDVPVENGTYAVTLEFAEIYFEAPDKRVFDVNVEGGEVELANYDIYAEAGALTATNETYTVDVTDGTLNVAFSTDVNNAKVSAIEVVQVDSDTGGGDDTNEAPSAAFTTSDGPTAGENVTFDASGSTDSDGAITSYAWDFGDGTTESSEVVNHTYESAGDYTVTLTVTDNESATNATSRTVTINESSSGGDGDANQAPTIDAIANQTVAEGNTTEVGVNASDPDGDDLTLGLDGPAFVSLADAGDGTGTLTIAPEPGDAGEYDVNVTANDGNATANESFALTVTAEDSQEPRTIEITGADSGWTGYTFTVSGDTLEKGAAANDGDSVSGTEANGHVVDSGTDSYEFTGTISTFAANGNVTVSIDGEVVDPDRLVATNTLVLRSTDSDREDYTFTVSSSDLAKSTATGASTNSGDTVSSTGDSATGYLVKGTDAYTYSGDLTDSNITGDGFAVYRNGQAVSFGDGGGDTNTAPTAAFTTDPSSPTAGETVTFDAAESTDTDGSIASYGWDFGDGATGSGETVAHTYESASDSTVTLTVTDDDGVTNTTQQTVTVTAGEDPSPRTIRITGADSGRTDYTFTVDGDTLQNGSLANDHDSVSGNEANGYVVGSGTDSYEFTGNLSTFATNGNVTVTIDGQAVNPNDLVETTTLVLHGTDDGREDYQFTVSSTDLQKSTAARATVNGGDTISGSGDGATGYVIKGADAYTFSGDLVSASHTGDGFTAFLNGQVVPFGNGTTSATQQTITVSESNSDAENEAPNASFTYSPTNPNTTENVTFDASTSKDADGTIDSYAWDFDSDGVIDSTTSDPVTTHAYAEIGTYQATLTVSDDGNATNSTSQTITVDEASSGDGGDANETPTAEAGADVVAEENTTVDLDGTDSFDPDGDALGYSWVQTAGPDVTLDAQDSPSPSFDAPSVDDNTTLAFELNVSDGNASDTDTVNVTVQDANVSDGNDSNAPPSATFTTSDSPTVGENVTFDASGSTDPNGSITSYEWDFGDETTGSSEVVNHTYDAAGDYTVILTVADNESTTNSTQQTITVNESSAGDGSSDTNAVPTAKFTYSPTSPDATENITFDASGSNDSDGTITEYAWDFDGDGAVDNTTGDPVTTHVYADNGTYTVTLVITDDENATNSTSQTITVDESGSGDSSGTTSASVTMNEGSSTIDASTYSSGSFQITNTGEGNISSVTFDLSTSAMPDMVFDPDGTAGDKIAKGFTADSGASATGQTSHQLSDPENGNPDDGYNQLTVSFDDFEPGETFAFSIDVDPTSIKGSSAPGPNEAGSVSGLELSGSTVTVEGANGATDTNDAFSDGSNGGSQAVVAPDVAQAPSIDVEGVTPDGSALDGHHSGATVAEQNQTVTVSGPVGGTVELLRIEGALFEPDGGAYEPEEYEMNSATLVDTQSVALGSDGTATVAVTINQSGDGLTSLLATARNDAGNTGRTSNVVVLRHDSGTSTTTTLSTTNTTTETTSTDDGGDADSTGVAPTAAFTSSPSTPNASEEVTFDASGSNDSDGEITEYAWDFDGDGTIDTTTSEPVTTHAYADTGTRTVALTVIDDDGNADTESRTVTVGGSDSSDGSETSG